MHACLKGSDPFQAVCVVAGDGPNTFDVICNNKTEKTHQIPKAGV